MGTPCPLLDVPDEILILIAGHLTNSHNDLCALGRVCARLAEIADFHFYRRLMIRTNAQAKCLLQAVSYKHFRSRLMRELILLPTAEDAHNVPNCLLSIPDSMQTLTHLTIELPCRSGSDSGREFDILWQNRFWGVFEDCAIGSYVPRPHALQRLISCTPSVFVSNVLTYEPRRMSCKFLLFLVFNASGASIHNPLAVSNFHLMSMRLLL